MISAGIVYVFRGTARRIGGIDSPNPDHHWWVDGDHIHYYDTLGAVTRLSQQQIRDEALALIRQHPRGIRFMELAREVHRLHPETPFNSIPGALNPIGRAVYTDIVSKPARGLFVPTGAEDRAGAEPTVAEAEFYAPIANFLVEDAEDLTAAIPLGGRAAGNGKWGTPDVLGVYRPTPGDVLTWSPELLSVEVKTSTRDVVVAFGQAVAYQIFSAKSYVAVPEAISPTDRHELTVRCHLHGLGLILLGPTPDAEHILAVRARRCMPDTEATRRFLERLRRDPERFHALFGG